MQNGIRSTGKLSIESNNIFTILKKWLYTEPDIVFRELISNATDAIQKRSILSGKNLSSVFKGKITVILDTELNRLVIRDNGIGMDYDEVDKYINQIAFSGAEEFIHENSQAGKDSIIGHFGVGFYSAFMLANDVSLETRSLKDGAAAIRWDCDALMNYRLTPGTRQDIGTDVILHLSEDSPYLKKPSLVYESIKKYFIFSRFDIYFCSPEHDNLLVNDSDAIWRRAPEMINNEEMNTFYKDFFQDTADPVFWIQFSSLDIGLRGILFFRNTKNGTDDLDGTFKIYDRGIYVGQNIPAIIPKFINLQSGILECDNLPLVVSRSTIQEDNADNMPDLIKESLIQEVSIALYNIFTTDRNTYENHWTEISSFVKYGILQEKIFASVMTRKVIFEDIYGQLQTIDEYLDAHPQTHENTIFYASDRLDQAHYIEIFKKCKTNALLLDHVIDHPLMYKYEATKPEWRFIRIDSNIDTIYRGTLLPNDEAHIKQWHSLIIETLGTRLGAMELNFTRLTDESLSVLIVNDEMSRRLSDTMEIYGYINRRGDTETGSLTKKILLFNLNSPIVQHTFTAADELQASLLLHQLFDLALLSQQALQPEDMEHFIIRSEQILNMKIS